MKAIKIRSRPSKETA